MLKNHLKIAFRSLGKRKGFALINIVGLALGIWCSLLIGLWVMDEFKQDAFHEKGDRIYQLLQNTKGESGLMHTGETTAYPIGDALVEQFPEVVTRSRFTGPRNWALNISEELVEAQVAAADASFFDIFSFDLIKGNSKNCLAELKNIVISETLANNYFPDGKAMGKTLDLVMEEGLNSFIVSGIFKDTPQHSSLNFNAVIPIDNYLPFNTHYENWGNSWLTTYVLLDENTSLKDINEKIADLPERLAGADWISLFIQPFEDRYLYSKFEDGKVAGGRIDYIKLFLVIAIFTLLIACFNFINLTTAWSIKRSKEVGIKKVMGAGKAPLTIQFFMESLILVLVAALLAVLTTQLSLPAFNDIASKSISLDFSDLNFYLILISISLVTALFSGIYPAFFLSSFNPITALKGRIKGSVGQARLRKGMVIAQFCLCMIMVVGTIVVYLQLRYVQNKNLGLDKENIIYVPMDAQTYPRSKAFKTELAKYPSIKRVSASNGEFIDNMGRTGDPVWEGKNPESSPGFAVMDVDFDFLEMLDIKLQEGRYFSNTFATDTLNYIINAEAAKVMGLDNPVGKSLSFWGDEGGKIVGVVENFHFASLHNTVDPMILRCRPLWAEFFYVKSAANKIQEALASLEQVHEQFSSLPFKYHFLDETIEKVYSAEQKVEKLGGIFAMLAIFISCLGLFGLAAFMANQRTKEIAVRKVLGASVLGLFQMLSKDFIKLVAIALLIAVPVTWYYLNQWIQGFAFHINISWWMFASAGLMVLLVALATVSYQTLRAAHRNPAKSLRTE